MRQRRRPRLSRSSRTAEENKREQKDRDPKRLLTAVQRDLCLLLKDKTKPNNTFARSCCALHGIKLQLVRLSFCFVAFCFRFVSFLLQHSRFAFLSSLSSPSPQQTQSKAEQSKADGVRLLFLSVSAVAGGSDRARQPRLRDRHHVEPLVPRSARRRCSGVEHRCRAQRAAAGVQHVRAACASVPLQQRRGVRAAAAPRRPARPRQRAARLAANVRFRRCCASSASKRCATSAA
jgi:hypothetical protein